MRPGIPPSRKKRGKGRATPFSRKGHGKRAGFAGVASASAGYNNAIIIHNIDTIPAGKAESSVISRSGLRVSILREVPEDCALGDEWNALVFGMGRPQVFYTYEWARAVQRAYGAMLPPLLVLARDEGGRLVGVAALAAPAGGPVSFLCATTGDYCDFVVSEANAGAFTGEVVQALQGEGYRDVVLTNFPEDSPAYASLAAAARTCGFHAYARTAYDCAQVRISKVAVKEGRLELPRQKTLRRSLRAMGGDSPPKMEDAAGWEEVEGQLPEFFRAHVARFLHTGRISNLAQRERRDFLVELARLLAPRGWLRMSRMTAGSRTVAWNYGFKFGGSWFWYQPTFVNDLEKVSPGFVLLSKLIEQAAEESAEVVDLGLGAEAYKDGFANEYRRTMYVTLHRSRIRHWMEIARYRVAERLRQWPEGERVARSVLAKADALKRRVRVAGGVAAATWVGSRIWKWIYLREEVFFFEGGVGVREAADANGLHPVSYDLLADAAMQFCDDDERFEYLLRAAKRLHDGKAEGFVLLDSSGRPVHFAWVAAFDGFFLRELNRKLKAPAEDCLMIFDCWTPAEERGRGYYGRAVNLLAGLIRDRGKRPWIFSAGSNAASLRGLAKAGFEKRYSLVRRQVFESRVLSREK